METSTVGISDLVGRTICEIVGRVGSYELAITCMDGTKYRMYHEQDCCESVTLHDVVGDFDDLIGLPVLLAEERTSGIRPDDLPKPQFDLFGTSTWTFYEFATFKGRVTLRWLGESNGYYCEAVFFEKVGEQI